VITIVRAADQRVVPWKNGLGTTREVAVDPPDGDVARGFRWRVSLATIERDCPFSAFPGHDRHIMVVRGQGMTLTVQGRDASLGAAPSRVLSFPGEVPAACRLHAGPVLDLNVMTDRARASAWLEVVGVGPVPRLLPRLREDEALVVVALGGGLALRHPGGQVELADLDAARPDGADGPCELVATSAEAIVAVARITLARA
jgi:environmental stress-induced protein Ves